MITTSKRAPVVDEILAEGRITAQDRATAGVHQAWAALIRRVAAAYVARGAGDAATFSVTLRRHS